MRRLVTERGGGGRKRSASSDVKSRSLPRNVLTVDSLEEYRRVVGEENDKIVVVRFYASWCKACKAMAPLFYRLASLHPDVKFVDVPVSEQNANLHQGLGVPSLPFGHVYHPASGLVEEAKLNRRYFRRFADAVRCYATGECELREGESDDPYGMLEEGAAP